ncbi:hypothetical protein OH77DRAFT_1105488 [Trametes cingulata]|nr:hypothetical protein OH77DRAFT_1105488 [Trametes cingulata]
MSAAQMSPAQLATAADHLMAAKMYSLASCVMLFYDIMITFGDEVENIWKQRFTGATVLWFLNRYVSPLGYIVIIVSFHDPSWSKSTCQRYVLYPEALKIVTAAAIGLIFILRLYSIYSKRSIILYGFGALLIAELAVKIWAFTDGTMLQLPPGFVGCILTGRSSPGDRLIYTWVAELVFDSLVFIATLYRTLELYRRTVIGETQSLITIIMRDGIMYFAAIFVSNLVTVLIFVFATPDLKVINASFSTLITSLMVSRLMLNLRIEVGRRGPVLHDSSGGRVGDAGHSGAEESYELTASSKAFATSIIGNLGAPILTFERGGYEDEYDHYEASDGNSSSRQGTRGSSGQEERSDVEVGHSHPPPGGRGPLGEAREDVNMPSPSAALSSSSTHPFSKPLPTPPVGIPIDPDRDRVMSPHELSHTRTLPTEIVVQVTKEVVVVGEVCNPPFSSRAPASSLTSPPVGLSPPPRSHISTSDRFFRPSASPSSYSRGPSTSAVSSNVTPTSSDSLSLPGHPYGRSYVR